MAEKQVGSKKRQGKRKWLRAILLTLVGLILVTGGTIGGYAIYLDRKVDSSLSREDLLPEQAAPPGGKHTPTVTRAPEAGDAMNILLIGTDERPGEGRGRSDVMVLVHINRARSGISLIHLPRDMQVPIPGHGPDKINASYARGGAPLLVSTVQELLNVRIDHVAQIGFDGFKAMTDAVGGVDVDVREASPGFEVGTTHLDGARALTFVRERYRLSEGDISRGRRQQAFLKGLILKATSAQTIADPRRLTSLIESAASHATVDRSFTTGDIRSLAFELRSVRGRDIRFITAPITGYATRPDGASIDVIDPARMKQLGHALTVDDMDSYKG